MPLPAKRKSTLLTGLTLVLLTCNLWAQQDPPPAAPAIEPLGDEHYRIGAIHIDKRAGRFSVAGRVLRKEPPIEFLVATLGGAKSYESVLEVDANAFEFNLACILIGLQSDDQQPVYGPNLKPGTPYPGTPVAVQVRWTREGNVHNVPGARILVAGDPPATVQSDQWVYSPPPLLPGGRFLPELSGTLLGVVHKGESLIEHRQGVGIGNYGSISVNPSALPEVGEAIELMITRVQTTTDDGSDASTRLRQGEPQ